MKKECHQQEIRVSAFVMLIATPLMLYFIYFAKEGIYFLSGNAYSGSIVPMQVIICSEHNVTVDYAFQDINDIPGVLPEGRTKPWGTGQAVLAAKEVLTTPFIVINADDYYGKL